MLGGNVGRAKGTKQQGLLSLYGRLCACPRSKREQERPTKKMCEEYTRGAAKSLKFLLDFSSRQSEVILERHEQKQAASISMTQFFVLMRCKLGSWRRAQKLGGY